MVRRNIKHHKISLWGNVRKDNGENQPNQKA